MIYKIACRFSALLAKNCNMPNEDIDFVSYGLFTLISKLVYFLICILIGCIFQCFAESCIFYLVFLFVKKYCGGFHAKTENMCFAFSTLSILISVIMISFTLKYRALELALYGLSAIGITVIAIFAPIESKEHNLDEKEHRKYSIMTKIRVAVLLIVTVIMKIFGLSNMTVPICAAVVLGSILIALGKKYNVSD